LFFIFIKAIFRYCTVAFLIVFLLFITNITVADVDLNIRVQSKTNKLTNSLSTNLRTVLYISVLTWFAVFNFTQTRCLRIRRLGEELFYNRN